MPFENDLFKKKYLKYKKKYIDLKNSGMRGGGWIDTSVTPPYGVRGRVKNT